MRRLAIPLIILSACAVRGAHAQILESVELAKRVAGVATEVKILTNIDKTMRNLEKIEKAREQLRAVSHFKGNVTYVKELISLIEITKCQLEDLDPLLQVYLDKPRKKSCSLGFDYKYIFSKLRMAVDLFNQIAEEPNLTYYERNALGSDIGDHLKELKESSRVLKEEVERDLEDEEFRASLSEGRIRGSVRDFHVSPAPFPKDKVEYVAHFIIQISLILGLLYVVYDQATNPNSKALMGWVAALVLYNVILRVFLS